jgi:hypothetical protein
LKQNEFNCKFIRQEELIDLHHYWSLRSQEHLPNSFFLSYFGFHLLSCLQYQILQSRCLDHTTGCTLQLHCFFLIVRTFYHCSNCAFQVKKRSCYLQYFHHILLIFKQYYTRPILTISI